MPQEVHSRDTLLLALTDRLRDGEPEEALFAVSEMVGRFFGCSRVGFRHLVEDGRVFDCRVCWTDNTVPPLLGKIPAKSFGPKIVAKLALGETAFVNDLLSDPLIEDPTTKENARRLNTRAILVVPFLWSGRLRSMIYLNNRTPRTWSDDDIALVEEIADRARRIIELWNATRERDDALERLKFLDQLGREIVGLSNPTKILTMITRMVGEYLDASICAYADMDYDDDGFTIRGDWNASGSSSIVGHYRLADFGTLAVANLHAGRPLVINNATEELAPREAASFQALGIAATVCMPLVKEGRLRALMAVHHQAPHKWTDGEISLIREVTERSWAHVERIAADVELRVSEARLELATSAAEIGIWDWDLATNKMTYSPRAKAISGFADDAEVTYEMVRKVVHPEDYPITSAQAQRALDPKLRERVPFEYRIVQPNGTTKWVVAHGIAVFTGEGSDARATRYVGTLQDVTDTRRLQESERAAAQRLKLALDAGRMAVWEVDATTDVLSASPELNRILGFPEDAHPTREEIRTRYFPGEYARVQEIGRAALERGERFIEAEYRYVLPRGDVRWLLLRCEVQFKDNKPARAVGVLTDVTARKEMEEHRELLVAELSHRVKNTLATVVAIEKQSYSRTASLEQGRDSFRRRILALSQTHTRLAEGAWSGVELQTLLEDELRPYKQDNNANVVMSGPAVVLNAKAALTLGMAFHELVTNAAKYGSLAGRQGALQISWTVAQSELQLSWHESAGRPIEPSTRKGFGMFLLKRGLAADLKGKVEIDLAAAGLRCLISVPLDRLQARETALVSSAERHDK